MLQIVAPRMDSGRWRQRLLLLVLRSIDGRPLAWPATFSMGDWHSEEQIIPRSVLQDLNNGSIREIGRSGPVNARDVAARRSADFQWLNQQDFNNPPRYFFQDVALGQRVSKFPGLRHVGDRNWLLQRVREAEKKKLPLDISSLPRVYNLPAEQHSMPKDALYFLKSPNLHGGHVEVARHSDDAISTFLSKMHKQHGSKVTWVAQDYVKPLLFDGRKFHIRLFVLVTGTHPLKIWILPRWSYFELAYANHSLPVAGAKIDQNQLLKDVTNNPFTERVRPQDIEANPGRYWKPLEDLHELGEGIFAEVIEQMKEAVATTMVLVSPKLQDDAFKLESQRSGFELLGYDVLIDADLRARILEINRSPSMAAHSEQKRARKASLLGDVFCIVGLGCERASLHPARIPDDETDMLSPGAEDLDAIRCLAREEKRAARTGAVQAWPDAQLTAKFWQVIKQPRYESARYFPELRHPQDRAKSEL